MECMTWWPDKEVLGRRCYHLCGKRSHYIICLIPTRCVQGILKETGNISLVLSTGWVSGWVPETSIALSEQTHQGCWGTHRGPVTTTSHCLHSSRSIIRDQSQPAHPWFDLLPSGERYRSIQARTIRMFLLPCNQASEQNSSAYTPPVLSHPNYHHRSSVQFQAEWAQKYNGPQKRWSTSRKGWASSLFMGMAQESNWNVYFR